MGEPSINVWRMRSLRDGWLDCTAACGTFTFLGAVFTPTLGPWPVSAFGLGLALGLWRAGVWSRRAAKAEAALQAQGGRPMNDREKAIGSGQAIIDDYGHGTDDSAATVLANVLCDLMHFSQARGLDWGYAMQDAERNYREESRESAA